MELFEGKICVTFEDLTVGCDGEPAIMPAGTLKSLLSRHPKMYARNGRGLNGHALIYYSSIPARYRQRFEEKKGDPATILKDESMKEIITIDSEARHFYDAYRYDKGGISTALTTSKIEEYTINASVLNHLIYTLGKRKGNRNSLGNPTTRTRLMDTVMGDVEQLRATYGHTLPANVARLTEKIRQYKSDGYGCLISGKLGNENTIKITDAAASWLIAMKRSAVPVYTDTQIFDEYNRVCESRGWKPLKSQQSLRLFLYRADIEPLWYDAVYGERAAFQRYGRKMRTKLPECRDALWYGDGTKLNLYYKGVSESGAWVVRTTQVYEVIDAYSEVLLGYHISDTENYEQQYNAFRMAVQFSGHRPFELAHDNQGGHKKANSTDIFKRICHIHRPTAPYTPQAKTIESVFGRFQQQVLHKDWRFTGQNITTKKDSSHPNMERIYANVESLYTLQELKAAYAAARQEWNEMAHPATGVARMEMYNSSVNAQTPVITPMDMVDIFWLKTDRESTFTDSGILITIKNKEYRYEVFSSPGVPDLQWRALHTGEKFITMYDPYDMSSVRLYHKEANGDLRFVVSAEPYLVIHRAAQDQTHEERQWIRSQIEANADARVDRQVQVRLIEEAHGMSLEQQGLNRPDLKGLDKQRSQELEHRVRASRLRKYDKSAVDMGRVTKAVSNITFDQLPKDSSFDERRVASKI